MKTKSSNRLCLTHLCRNRARFLLALLALFVGVLTCSAQTLDTQHEETYDLVGIAPDGTKVYKTVSKKELQGSTTRGITRESATSGDCGAPGSNVRYTFDSATGTLTISGTGAIDDYDFDKHVPWHDLSRQIKSIIVNEGITRIGKYAFSCPIEIDSDNVGWYMNMTNLAHVSLPNSMIEIGKASFLLCSFLDNVILPGNLINIEDNAFQECKALTTISLPKGVTKINNAVFLWCTSLTSINIPNSVTSIGNNAFNGCSSLKSVTLPNSVKSLDYWAFGHCESLTHVTIPNSMTSIGYCAFSDCSSLTSVTIPNSVTYIEDGAFSGCPNLIDVTNLATEPQKIYGKTFSYYHGNLHVKKGCGAAYKAASYWGQFTIVEDAVDASTKTHYTVSNRTDVEVDFHSLNEAMNTVKDGDVITVLEGTSFSDNQTITKSVKVEGPGYFRGTKDAMLSRLTIKADGAEVTGLTATYIFVWACEVRVKHCRVICDIYGTEGNYENELCTIHSCFIEGRIVGEGTYNTDAWTITNNIIRGGILRFDNAWIEHNTIVTPEYYTLFQITNSEIRDNLLFNTGIRSRVYSDVANNTWSHNLMSDKVTGCYLYNETLSKCIVAQGSNDLYYRPTGSSLGNATDGSDIGAFGGANPYVINGTDDPIDPVDPDTGFRIEPNDLLALKTFFNEFGGSKWTKKWEFESNGTREEAFPGVKFIEEGEYFRVQEINLPNNNISGRTNDKSTLYLPQLTYLNLQNNHISGTIGQLVNQLERLKTLNVRLNRFKEVGKIPSNVATFDKGGQFVYYDGKSYDYQGIEYETPVKVFISEWQENSLPSIFTYDDHVTYIEEKEEHYVTHTNNIIGLLDNKQPNYFEQVWRQSPYIYEHGQDYAIVLTNAEGSAYPAYLHFTRGDADMDGFTDIVDVQTTIVHILNPYAVSLFGKQAANTYMDDIINVQDVVSTVNIVLGREISVITPPILWAPESPRRAKGTAEIELSCSMQLMGEQVCLTCDEAVGAMAIELAGVKTDQVSLQLNHNDFQMKGVNTEEGSRYVIYSLSGKELPAGMHNILRVADEEATLTATMISSPDARKLGTRICNTTTDLAEVTVDDVRIRFADDNLLISTSEPLNDVQLQVVNMAGVTVLSQETACMMPGSHKVATVLPAGIYAVEMKAAGKQPTIVKLIKK